MLLPAPYGTGLTHMSEVSVRPVKGKRDLDAFIELPFRLHRGTPWVPPLVFERRDFLNRDKNPFFEHADAEYFLAERDGKVVGRITAHLDERWTQFQGGNDGMFGFFETENDPEVARALLDTAKGWLRERGRERMLGPMDFTTNDECGILIEGYELDPLVLEPWHPPYYRQILEGLGMTKTMDLLMWELYLGKLKQGDRFHDFIHEAARKAEAEHGVTVRHMRKRDLEAEVARFMDVYNAAWGPNWGFVPITEEEVRFQAKNLKPILDENWAMIAEREGEVVGAALTLPDINQVLAKMNGRLFPFGWWHFLTGRSKIDKVRVFALGVKPEYQHFGVAAALFVRHVEVAARVRQKGGEMGWILEVNEPMNRAMEGMGGSIVKRYRLYESALAG
ncbi:MAG: GNAT family N-acetyltransferase [Solirubrobacterales bacterium]